MGGQLWPELELYDRAWECSLERGERGKKRVKEWGSLGAARGRCAAAGGAGLLLCTCSLLREFYCFVRRRKPT
jgi:hypothetical protein